MLYIEKNNLGSVGKESVNGIISLWIRSIIVTAIKFIRIQPVLPKYAVCKLVTILFPDYHGWFPLLTWYFLVILKQWYIKKLRYVRRGQCKYSKIHPETYLDFNFHILCHQKGSKNGPKALKWNLESKKDCSPGVIINMRKVNFFQGRGSQKRGCTGNSTIFQQFHRNGIRCQKVWKHFSVYMIFFN